MTELETIERARMYLDKMAKGIDPLTDKPAAETDMINQVRISKCLFFVSNILRRVLENGGIGSKPKQKQSPKLPLEISVEQLSRFEPDPQGLTISNLAKRINALIDNEDMIPLKYTAITEWLQQMGMLKTVVKKTGTIRTVQPKAAMPRAFSLCIKMDRTGLMFPSFTTPPHSSSLSIILTL